MKSGTPEEVPDETVVAEQPVAEAAPESKQRRQRKPKEPPAEEVATTPAETVAETTAPAEAPQQPQQPEWLKRLETDLGFQNVTDETEARDRLLEFALREKQERQRLEEDYQRRLREMEYRQVAQAGQQVPETPAAERKPWQPPVEYPAAAARYLDGADENGNAKWKPETPVEVRAQTDKFIAWRDDMRDAILNRPDVFFGEILPAFINEHAQKVIEPFYEERTAEQQKAAFFEEFKRQHAEWLFQKDPTTGRPGTALSRVGQALDQRVSFHLERGLSPQEAVEYAQFDVQRQTGMTPWVKTEPTPQEVRQQKKSELESRARGGANSIASRRGSFTEPEDARPQNGHVSPGRSLLQLARQEGVDLPYAMPN